MFNVITVIINGSPKSFAPPLNFAELVTQLGLTGKRVAIERNGEIVPRGLFMQHQLSDGDKIELVVAVGGG
jgi:sulfur carrier protein